MCIIVLRCAAGRWGGAEHGPAGPYAECGQRVVAAGTTVAVEGGCEGPSGLEKVFSPLMRAEMGAPFVLDAVGGL